MHAGMPNIWAIQEIIFVVNNLRFHPLEVDHLHDFKIESLRIDLQEMHASNSMLVQQAVEREGRHAESPERSLVSVPVQPQVMGAGRSQHGGVVVRARVLKTMKLDRPVLRRDG